MSIKRSNQFSLNDNAIQSFLFPLNLSTNSKHSFSFARNNGLIFIRKTKCMSCNTGFKRWSWNMLSSLGNIIFYYLSLYFFKNPHDIAIWLMERIIEVENCHFSQGISPSSHSDKEDCLTFITMVSKTHTHSSLNACRVSSLPLGWVNSDYILLSKVNDHQNQYLWPHS